MTEQPATRGTDTKSQDESDHEGAMAPGERTPADRTTTSSDTEADSPPSAEEFAREHDPAKHDVAAGEELRQRGDWTADAAGGPQVWDAEGNLVEGTSPAEPTAPAEQPEDGAGEGTADERRTSSLDEVRDGGYSVGSAAVIDDGAVPLGHPVKAWESSKTFTTPDHPDYADAEPELWFTDGGAARRAGFRPIEQHP